MEWYEGLNVGFKLFSTTEESQIIKLHSTVFVLQWNCNVIGKQNEVFFLTLKEVPLKQSHLISMTYNGCIQYSKPCVFQR